MAQRFDNHVDTAGPRGPSDQMSQRTVKIGKTGPDPLRVAQFVALTFLVGISFLFVGYALS